MKNNIILILILLTFVLLLFMPTSFAQDDVREYLVRVIYFLPNDREAEVDVDAKLDAMIKKIQEFYAVQMQAHGFARKTFAFEADEDGNAIIHQINGRFDQTYYQGYGEVWREVEEQFDISHDGSKHIYLCLLDSTENCLIPQQDRNKGCVVGLGSGNSLNGSALVLYDNIADEDRIIYSDNVAIHELGHAFGLVHDRRSDAERIDTFDYSGYMVTSFCAASWLDAHRYFNVRKKPFNRNTTAKMLTPILGSPWYYIRFRFEVSDPDGLHQVQLFAPELDSVIAYENLDGESKSTIEFVTNNWTRESYFILRVMDVHGNIVTDGFPMDVADLLPSAEVISIPDTHFATTIKETLAISKDDPITQLDMLRLRRLDVLDSKITDITGLEHAVNLETLNCDGFQIGDFTPLTHLTQLKELMLRSMQLQDITPLAALPALEVLRLSFNHIRDITPLANMTQLKHLGLSDNQVTDLTPLTSLQDLEGLYLELNPINDIKVLARITQLKSLSLLDTQLTDITPLANLEKLTYLDLRANQLTDITPLTNLKKLESLELWNNQITDITPLTALVALEYLNISDNLISDVSVLLGLENLKTIMLVGNPIENRKPLLALLRKNPGINIYLKNRDEPLPVSLSHFHAAHTNAGVVITWTTESEVDNAGFYIYRSETRDGNFKVVNANLIQGAGTTGERTEYTWTDTTAKPNTVYYYQIEDVSHAGDREQLATVRLKGLVSAKDKQLTKWSDLKRLTAF